jgi:NitT/TauT family transport system substrate-binding protein
MRKLPVAALLAALALALPPRAAVADDTLHVAAAFAGGIEVLENVAKYGGLYAAEHLDVDKQYTGSGSICVQLAATGKIDACATSLEPTILGYDKGIRLQMFFSRVHDYEFVLAVLADSPIKTLADFKGKQIGEPSVGDASEIQANDSLAGAGLKRSDYSFVPIGVGGQALSALAAHKVDALTTSATALGTEAAVAHLKFRIFHDPILGSIPDSGFEARPDVIAAKADLFKRYVRAIVKAAILVRENPRVAARYTLMGENVGTKITPEALDTETAELIGLQSHLVGTDPRDTRLGETPLASIALYCKLLNDTGWTSTLVPAQAIVTNQFIAYGNDFDHKAWIAEVKKMR